MVTVGLSWHELERITKILDEHALHYTVGSPETATHEQTEKPLGDSNSFYQIEIPHIEYLKLPVKARQQLENLGIYPELEIPSFEETPSRKLQTPRRQTHVEIILKKILWTGLIIIGLGYYLAGEL